MWWEGHLYLVLLVPIILPFDYGRLTGPPIHNSPVGLYD